MELRDKRVAVVGTGKSGIAATKLLETVGAKVILIEGNKEASYEDIKRRLPVDSKASIIIGAMDEECMPSFDLLVISPGVPFDLEFVNIIREKNIPVWGEIELAYNYSKGRVVAITGTNGKTTTTALVGEIMESYYESVFVVGNIGIPYTDMVLDTNLNSVTVAEISSFQLETIHLFKPDVSCILNITPDHLDRHHTLDNYIATKMSITKNQDKDNFCILNYEDLVLREFGRGLKSKVIYFSSLSILDEGIYLENDNIIYKMKDKKIIICNVKELNIFGRHSYENVMAAIGIALSVLVPIEHIKKAITSFKAVEHRIEYVATKKGVRYYNDSKGTNIDAAIKAIESMETPTILIGGGYDKNSEFDDWIKAFNNKVKHLILLGETKYKIAETARRYGFDHITMVESIEEAVVISSQTAVTGDSVLLSPACASWGMFKNYEERGNMFKKFVNNLRE